MSKRTFQFGKINKMAIIGIISLILIVVAGGVVTYFVMKKKKKTPAPEPLTIQSVSQVTIPSVSHVTSPSVSQVTSPSVSQVTIPSISQVTVPVGVPASSSLGTPFVTPIGSPFSTTGSSPGLAPAATGGPKTPTTSGAVGSSSVVKYLNKGLMDNHINIKDKPIAASYSSPSGILFDGTIPGLTANQGLTKMAESVPEYVSKKLPQHIGQYNFISVFSDGGFRLYKIPDESVIDLQNYIVNNKLPMSIILPTNISTATFYISKSGAQTTSVNDPWVDSGIDNVLSYITYIDPDTKILMHVVTTNKENDLYITESSNRNWTKTPINNAISFSPYTDTDRKQKFAIVTGANSVLSTDSVIKPTSLVPLIIGFVKMITMYIDPQGKTKYAKVTHPEGDLMTSDNLLLTGWEKAISYNNMKYEYFRQCYNEVTKKFFYTIINSQKELWVTADFNGSNWHQITDLPGTPVSINQYTDTNGKLKYALGCTNNRVYFKSSL